MSKEKDHNITFLFGAGASAEAGVCTSDKITEILINYGSYCPSENSTEIENLLKYIQVKIADFLHVRASDVNFEYVLGTLMELGRREEYPIVPLLGEGDALVKKLEEKISLNEVIDKLFALLRELLFIRNPVDYLYPLKNLVDLSKPLDLFTLNYDLTLETVFYELNIPYTTGYRKREKDLPIWDPSEFRKKTPVVRLFKLHGSIDWGQFFNYPPSSNKRETDADTVKDAEYYIANYPERVAFDPYPVGLVEPPERTIGMVSIMNFGTRKELLYASSQFTMLFNHFLNKLLRIKTCVIAGYSFRDDRINKMIEEAVVTRKGDLRLIIVNPSVFWIERNNSVLWEFARLGWSTSVAKSLGLALKDGSLLTAIESSNKAKTKSAVIFPKISFAEEDGSHQQKPIKSERILEEWRDLGMDFDVAYFWMKFLAPELRELKDFVNESEAIKVGLILMPLIRKVRDLCYRICWLYDEMQFGDSYRGEHLENIKIDPKVSNKFVDTELVRRGISNLGMGVSGIFSRYNHSKNEFQRAVSDPEYGADIGAPSNISAAELIIRRIRGEIYELAWILNDIYKGAGYEEPFEMIAKHQQQLMKESEEYLRKVKEQDQTQSTSDS